MRLAVVGIHAAESHRAAQKCVAARNKISGVLRLHERFVAVLEIPPVVSPETAVKVAIVAEVRDKK